MQQICSSYMQQLCSSYMQQICSSYAIFGKYACGCIDTDTEKIWYIYQKPNVLIEKSACSLVSILRACFVFKNNVGAASRRFQKCLLLLGSSGKFQNIARLLPVMFSGGLRL
jgi:hypothetical protein